MNYSNIINSLLSTFPEFANSKLLNEGYDSEIPHSVMAAFAEYFKQLISNSRKPSDDETIKGIINFLNEMADSPDDDVVDLLMSGFYESVDNNENIDQTLEVLKNMLSEKAIELLRRSTEWYVPGTKERMCQICGYRGKFEFPPRDKNNVFELCPSCGFQFPNVLFDKLNHQELKKWRDQWIKDGMQWMSQDISQPSDWNPRKQLNNIINISY